MHKIVVSAIGKDRPGIVSKVTGVLYRHHASIEDSSMTILEGNFTMIMIVAIPEKAGILSFQKDFKTLQQKLRLIISIQEPKVKPQIGPFTHNGKPYILSVLGGDKPGIVHGVAKLLARRRINITDLNTKVIGREDTKNVYAMVLEVEVPASVKEAEVSKELASLGEKLKVDVTFRPIESLNL